MTSSEALPKKPRSFDPPAEPAWHRMIAETAYYLAERRGFQGAHSLDDWLTAEQQVRQMISPISEAEATMRTPPQNGPQSDAEAAAKTTRQAGDTKRQRAPQAQPPSRFEKFAATQAAGDGVQGDTLKKDQTVDEKIGANMADRK
jgi:hypothetical protein